MMRAREKQQKNKPLRTLHGQKLQLIHQNEHRGNLVHLSVQLSIQHQVGHLLIRVVLMNNLEDNLHNVKRLKIPQYLILMTV